MFFTLYWRDGRKNIVEGKDPADAMNKAGYGAGALGALDFWTKSKDEVYAWNQDTRTWDYKPK